MRWQLSSVGAREARSYWNTCTPIYVEIVCKTPSSVSAQSLFAAIFGVIINADFYTIDCSLSLIFGGASDRPTNQYTDR